MPRINHISAGIFLVASMTLMVEILLIRVFEVLFQGHIGYLVVTCAMFALGFSGVLATIRPLRTHSDVGELAAKLTLVLALIILVMRPVLNASPDLYQAIEYAPLRYILGIGIVYSAVLIPFFVAGLIFAYIFSAGAANIGRLYFFDLAGAALGCLIWIPFMRLLGPGGLMLWAVAILLLAAALFAGRRSWSAWIGIAATILVVIPFVLGHERLDFDEHQDKRGVRSAKLNDRIEFSEWDPVSKIYVVDLGDGEHTPKHVAYDGGSQSTHFFPFDGDFAALREQIVEGAVPTSHHFWIRGLLVSHFLKRDTGATVLICGSAGGQETKAALTFGAAQVDGIELVETVVRLGKGPYAELIGNIFDDPRVDNRRGEARAFLRSTDRQYDIIQIFSNHTSSTIAAGSNAFSPVYLQTAEAYKEYFEHLNSDGILHINHHFYPRMITTAALAWEQLGRQDFQKHVLVYAQPNWDTLPTMLIKMSPWTPEEVAEVQWFFDQAQLDGDVPLRVVDPLDVSAGTLSPEFFTGSLPADLVELLDYDARPSTDDWPFFNNIQRHFRQVTASPDRFLNESMASAINGRHGLPGGEYAIYIAAGIVGLVYAVILVLLPMALSPAGRRPWAGKHLSLAYFASLGLGFIIIELVLIQIFMKMIGFPVYAYALVIMAMLASAALGSLTLERLQVHGRRWPLPFVATFIIASAYVFGYPSIADTLLSQPLAIRIISVVALIVPLGYFMGMPLPLGILTIKAAPPGAVAWAWGMNGTFTVVGGLLAGISALFIGFQLTMLAAATVYVFAMILFALLRASMAAPVSELSVGETEPGAELQMG